MARKARNHPVPRNMTVSTKAESQTSVSADRFNAALYIRLSKEDGGKDNQNTVENQRALLEEFVTEQQDVRIYNIYEDNGFSGTNFARPAFQRMMEDVKAGKVNCIIVKDLSRFGRSYLEVGNYIEKIFPFLKVRFISVTDRFDTYVLSETDSGTIVPNGIDIPLKNIINEIYAKDISKKVGTALDIRKREGKYGGGVAPYGYKKSATVQGKYEVDEEAAEVVRYIFRLRKEGKGYCTIVKILNEKGIKSPSAYRFEKGIVKDARIKDVIWKTYAIMDMLCDEVYLGNMVRGKTRSAMHKGEKRHRVPKSEWIVVPGTHEPIIDRELFDAVQDVNNRRAQGHKKDLERAEERPRKGNILKGKLFCGDCGTAMGYNGDGKGYMNYHCRNYRENGAMGCFKKNISALKLNRIILETIQVHIGLFLQYKGDIQARNSGEENKRKCKALEAEIQRLRMEKEQYQRKTNSLYLDYKEKLLTVQEYFAFKDKYQMALAENEQAIREKLSDLTQLQEDYGDGFELAKEAGKYAGQQQLTQEMVDALIERIDFFSKDRIHIIFRYEDQFQEIVTKGQEIESERQEGVE